MKKSLLLGILGLGAVTMSSHGQGILFLQNYTIPGAPYVNYGAGVPANGVSGAIGSGPVSSTAFTVGFYWAAGAVSVPTDSTGSADISGLLTLATGGGSTATVAGSLVFGTAGAYQASSAFAVPGVVGGGTITMETTVYTGASYAAGNYRGHSEAFQVVLGAPTGSPTPIGSTALPMSVFTTTPVPEPSVLALSGLGAAALMAIRRKKVA